MELKLVENPEFEKLEGEHQERIFSRNALRLLTVGWSANWSEHLVMRSALRAAFVERDPKVLKAFRYEFQQGFRHLYEELKDKQLSEEEHEKFQLFLSNSLNLLPYSDLTPYESISIPQYINNQLEWVEYTVKPIELTDHKQVAHDYDRVFSYGLTPLNHPEAHPHLIFMGTTYPAGQGFGTQVSTDLKPFETVGESIYRTGKARILEWMDVQTKKIYVNGVSLGGSLSLILAMDQGDKLLRVDAQNPAGLHHSSTKSEFDKWDELQIKPPVVIQRQGHDPVSALGVWKEDWKIWLVEPPENKKGPSGFWDHFLNYAGFEHTKFTQSDAKQENEARRWRNFWIYNVGRSLAYYLGVLPYQYVIRPVANFLWKHRNIVTTCAIATLALGVLTAFLVLGTLPAWVFISSLSVIGTSLVLLTCANLLAKLVSYTRSFRVKEEYPHLEIAHMHDPLLPRNAEMDIYNKRNRIELKLKYEDLQTYYKMTRCMLQGKSFLISPEDLNLLPEKGDKNLRLQECLKPENQDTEVSIKVTKAKAAWIGHSLSFAAKLGKDNEQALKEALEPEYRSYKLGKMKLELN